MLGLYRVSLVPKKHAASSFGEQLMQDRTLDSIGIAWQFHLIDSRRAVGSRWDEVTTTSTYLCDCQVMMLQGWLERFETKSKGTRALE